MSTRDISRYIVIGMAIDQTSALWMVRPLNACSPSELALVAAWMDRRSVAAGLSVVEQGDTGDEFFILEKGLARVLRDGEDVALLGPGECFGEQALLDGRPRTATVVAVTDIDVIVIPGQYFDDLLTQVVPVRRALLTALAHRLRDADEVSVR